MRTHSHAVSLASGPTERPLTTRSVVAGAVVLLGLLALASSNPLLLVLTFLAGVGAGRQ